MSNGRQITSATAASLGIPAARMSHLIVHTVEKNNDGLARRRKAIELSVNYLRHHMVQNWPYRSPT